MSLPTGTLLHSLPSGVYYVVNKSLGFSLSHGPMKWKMAGGGEEYIRGPSQHGEVYRKVGLSQGSQGSPLYKRENGDGDRVFVWR